jgi:hypothetical protein
MTIENALFLVLEIEDMDIMIKAANPEETDVNVLQQKRDEATETLFKHFHINYTLSVNNVLQKDASIILYSTS